MSQVTAAQYEKDWAIFLDVDGTLLEIAETPQAVCVPESLKIMINALCLRLDGALALISGRSIADLDLLFAPFRFCAAGVHGAQWREPSGCIAGVSLDASMLDEARTELLALAGAFPGLLMEDKQVALALHFRRVPHLQTMVRERMAQVVAHLGPQFVLTPGKCVFEIRPAAWSKATAMARFMERPPFVGRVPIFIGDDVTDEDGFAWVNGRRGMSIRVGQPRRSAAKYSLADVSEARTWLRSIPPISPARLRLIGEVN